MPMLFVQNKNSRHLYDVWAIFASSKLGTCDIMYINRYFLIHWSSNYAQQHLKHVCVAYADVGD